MNTFDGHAPLLSVHFSGFDVLTPIPTFCSNCGQTPNSKRPVQGRKKSKDPFPGIERRRGDVVEGEWLVEVVSLKASEVLHV